MKLIVQFLLELLAKTSAIPDKNIESRRFVSVKATTPYRCLSSERKVPADEKSTLVPGL